MSQITRCPSCATTFKVVADQLRISEGWVRCGQCKEIFDASAHLLTVAPAALLPDVSLADLPAPAAFTAAPDGVATEAPPAPVLDIPSPAVPAFLAAGGHADTSTNAMGEEASPSFTWRAHSAPRTASVVDAAASLWAQGPVDDVEPEHSSTSAADAKPWGDDLVRDHLVPAPSSVPSAGYELPFQELRESDGPLEALMDADTGETVRPSVEFAQPPAWPVFFDPLSHHGAASPDEAQRTEADLVPVLAPLAPRLPSGDFVPGADLSETPPVDLVGDASPEVIFRAQPTPSVDGSDETDTPESDPEVSFVVAARRKAFWRRPVVRGGLGLVLLISLLGLALQIAVHERDRIAALDVRTRPWLMTLCEFLGCELTPVRQIADVVIDSSSFNKARGDSYQLALTIKSTATIALAMPAVELTLTDAQDQPVLRRVLLPTDMAAPAELSAHGEWGTSVSVIVTTGGARVAGYRLLAFYP